MAGGYVWTIGIRNETHRKTGRTLSNFSFMYKNWMEMAQYEIFGGTAPFSPEKVFELSFLLFEKVIKLVFLIPCVQTQLSS